MKIIHIKGQFDTQFDAVIDAALDGISHSKQKDKSRYRISHVPTIIAINDDKLTEQEWRPDQPIDSADIAKAEADLPPYDVQTVFPPPPPPAPIEAKHYLERLTSAELDEFFAHLVQKNILSQARADEIKNADVV